MDREVLEKEIEKASSLLLSLKKINAGNQILLQEDELIITQSLEDINCLELELASLADMNQDLDQAVNLHENFLQHAEDTASKLDSMIYVAQNSLQCFEMETNELIHSYEKTLREWLGKCRQGVAMFSEETLKTDNDALSKKIEESVEKIDAIRQETQRLNTVLEELVNYDGLKERRDLKEESDKLTESLLTTEEEICKLDEELKFMNK